jgi:hypothetical protein
MHCFVVTVVTVNDLGQPTGSVTTLVEAIAVDVVQRVTFWCHRELEATSDDFVVAVVTEQIVESMLLVSPDHFPRCTIVTSFLVGPEVWSYELVAFATVVGIYVGQ